jgi:HSP20 family protein
MRLALSRDPYTMMRRMQNSLVNDNFFDFEWDDTQMDVYEEGDDVVVSLKAPGFDEKNIDISVEDNTITITGNHEQTEEEEDKSKKYFRKEIRKESFARSATLPKRVQADKADASFKNGILTIRMPKAEEAKPRKISVNVKS